jgi:hypothetical protein
MLHSELKANVAAWLNKTNLTAVIPTFISLAQDRIYLGSPELECDPLRIGDMLTVVNPFTGTLPSNWTEIKRMSWVLFGSIKYALDFMPLEKIGPYEGISGRPQFFSLRGDTVVYGPTFTNDVELMYYARPADLSADSDVIPASCNAIYLYGTMLEAALYLKDDDEAARLVKAYKNALNAVQKQDDGNLHSGNTLRIRSDSRVMV